MAQSGRLAVLHVSDDDINFLRVGNLNQAAESIQSQTEDRNIIGTEFQSRAALMLDRTVSCSGYYDPLNAGQMMIRDALIGKDELYTRAWPLGEDGRKQLCVVSSFGIGVSTGSLTTFSAELAGAGPVTNLAGAAVALPATETLPYSGRSALLKATGTPTAMTTEATTANATWDVYTITDAAKRVIAPYASVSVFVDATPVTSGWTVNRLLGTITFAVALTSSEVVTVTTDYLPRVTMAECPEYDLTINNNAEDSSVLGNTWMTRENTLGDVSGSFQRFHVNNNFVDRVIAQNVLLLEGFIQSDTTPEFRAWVYLTSTGVDPQATSLIREAVDFQGTIDREGRSIAFV